VATPEIAFAVVVTLQITP